MWLSSYRDPNAFFKDIISDHPAQSFAETRYNLYSKIADHPSNTFLQHNIPHNNALMSCC